MGEAADDEFGFSISLSSDGNILAIGGRFNDGNGENSGHAQVYKYNDTSWIQLGEDIDGEAAGDRFGRSISLSSNGTILAIGSTMNDNSYGDNTGHVRVYKYNDTSWIQLGEDIDGKFTNALFAYSLSLSSDGTILAIGDRYNDYNNKTDRGLVKVYKYTDNSWTQLGKIFLEFLNIIYLVRQYLFQTMENF